MTHTFSEFVPHVFAGPLGEKLFWITKQGKTHRSITAEDIAILQKAAQKAESQKTDLLAALMDFIESHQRRQP